MARKQSANNIQSFLPRGMLIFFAVSAFMLVPWAILLSQLLPSDHLASRWNLAWSGFDFGLVVILGLTAILGLRSSGWVIIPSSIAGTMLLIDAWFDCLTAKVGKEYLFSLSTAALVEIPMALMAFWMAYRAGRHYLKRK